MAGTRWSSKKRALVVATFSLAFAAFLRIAAPRVVSLAGLGDWQCSQYLLLVTTCTQIRQPVTATALPPV